MEIHFFMLIIIINNLKGINKDFLVQVDFILQTHFRKLNGQRHWRGNREEKWSSTTFPIYILINCDFHFCAPKKPGIQYCRLVKRTKERPDHGGWMAKWMDVLLCVDVGCSARWMDRHLSEIISDHSLPWCLVWMTCWPHQRCSSAVLLTGHAWAVDSSDH